MNDLQHHHDQLHKLLDERTRLYNRLRSAPIRQRQALRREYFQNYLNLKRAFSALYLLGGVKLQACLHP